MDLQPYGDNFTFVVPTDYVIHTPEHPQCSDQDCPCYDEIKAALAQHYQDGLITSADATRILEGRQLWQ